MKFRPDLLFTCSLFLLAVKAAAAIPSEVLSDFRIRSAFDLPLNANTGWAAGVNQPASVDVDRPFRLRVQLESEDGRDSLRHFVLWYRLNEGSWRPVVEADFPYPDYASPVVSLVKPPYPRGTATDDLLPQVNLEHGEDGAGQGLSPVSTRAGEFGVASEYEFPLVIRYFADGPICLEEGDRIEFRLGLLHGEPLPSTVTPQVTVHIPKNHLGGTFVETPGRIGPWQAEDGSLTFIMEPTETDNRFMMVKSTDDGASWREVDGDNRPPARDLEAVDAVRVGNLIHIVHMEDVVWYHAFQLPSREGPTEGWVTQSELIADPERPPLQSVGIEIFPDGQRLMFHADGPRIIVRTYKAPGNWPLLARIESGTWVSGIQVVRVPDNRIGLVYTDGDGNGWLQLWMASGPLDEPMRLTSGLGRTENDAASILRPAYLPEDNSVTVIYREQDGRLHERRLDLASGELSDPVQVVKGPVIQNAVDSDQTGADLLAYAGGLHLFFIPSESRDIFYTKSHHPGVWSEPVPLVQDIQGSWIRANGLDPDTIGFVYDAGSLGGSGMNRYGSVSASGK